MKYIYYVIYTLKQVAGALFLFCGGFCLLLNIQFMTGVEIDARLLVLTLSCFPASFLCLTDYKLAHLFEIYYDISSLMVRAVIVNTVAVRDFTRENRSENDKIK